MHSPIRCDMKVRHLSVMAGFALLLVVERAAAADGAVYQGLTPDAFMKGWCVLKPAPVSWEGKGEPTEEAQKAAFARDWFGVDGAASIRPSPETEVTIDGKRLKWRLVASKEDVV